MKKTLFIMLSTILVLAAVSFPNQLPLADESTSTPVDQVTPDLSSPTPESTIVATEEFTNSPGFEVSRDIPDTRETKEVIKAIEKAYSIEAKASYSFDFSKFSTIFTNDPRFPVSPGTLETVRQLTLNPTLETAGWLDYKIAYYSWMRDSILLAEAIHARAKSENRELAEEEKKLLKDPWGRTAPARAQSGDRKNIIRYLTVEINDDVAVVTLTRGMYYSELTLVLVDKNWYIAGEKYLSISP